MSIDPGGRLGNYRLGKRLGAGGAGEVYEAYDTKLERNVALKVVPGDVLDEARAAAALEHENILPVHDVGQADGQAFIVMPLVPGKSLRELMDDRRLSVDEALGLAIQIASGLAAAHRAGIIHRDVKPDNVMVTDDGVVKILDFGISRTEAEDASEALTDTHAFSGTPGYMSPEQAEGKPADVRSDLFSFGAVLYEMLAGERAFDGDTPAAVLTAVLRDEPKLGGVPGELAALLGRCLRKDPDLRAQSAADLRLALIDLRDVATTGRRDTASRRGTMFRTLALIAIAALVVALVASLRPRTESTVRLGPPRPVSTQTGHEYDPAISPDGAFVAFRWQNEGDLSPQLYVQRIGSGSPLALTENEEVLSPTWSPNGSEIAFIREAPEIHDVVVIPALGGTPRTVGRYDGGHWLHWTPDGEHFLITASEHEGEPAAVFAMSAVSGDLHRLTQPPVDYFGESRPAMSPDGRTVAFLQNDGASMYLTTVPFSGGSPTVLDALTFPSRITGVAWGADSTEILFGVQSDSGERSDNGLWSIGARGGARRRLGSIDAISDISMSGEGRRLVYRREQHDLNIWRLPGPTASSDDAQRPPQVAFPSTRAEIFPQPSPDNERLLFVSDRIGSVQVWVASLGGEPNQITYIDSMALRPRWSPDGTLVVYEMRSARSSGIEIVSAAGGIPRRLGAESDGEAVLPSFSRDGRFVYFGSNRGFDQAANPGRRNPFDLYRVPVDGGEPERLTWNGGIEAIESPDGSFIYFHKTDSSLWRIPAEGGEEERFLEGVGWQQWDVFEDGICYRARGGIDCHRFSSGAVERLTDFEGAPGRGFGVSYDGAWVYVARDDLDESDIMMVDVEWER